MLASCEGARMAGGDGDTVMDAQEPDRSSLLVVGAVAGWLAGQARPRRRLWTSSATWWSACIGAVIGAWLLPHSWPRRPGGAYRSSTRSSVATLGAVILLSAASGFSSADVDRPALTARERPSRCDRRSD